MLPHQDAEYVSHIAIDIGGSLIKLVYFLPDENSETDVDGRRPKQTGGAQYPALLSPSLLRGMKHTFGGAPKTCSCWQPAGMRHCTHFEDIFFSVSDCRAGKLHFVKFETAKIEEALEFIKANCLHTRDTGNGGEKKVVRIMATGGGAYKFSEIFQVLLGLGCFPPIASEPLSPHSLTALQHLNGKVKALHHPISTQNGNMYTEELP